MEDILNNGSTDIVRLTESKQQSSTARVFNMVLASLCFRFGHRPTSYVLKLCSAIRCSGGSKIFFFRGELRLNGRFRFARKGVRWTKRKEQHYVSKSTGD